MRPIYLMLLGAAVFAACGQNPNAGNVPGAADSATATANAALPENFKVFYEKFHTDSNYQVAHISFPLSGLQSKAQGDTATVTQAGQWTAAEWRFQQLDVLRSTNDYTIDYQTLGEDVVIERILTKVKGFGMERRFAKMPSGEWELIYYADMHAL